MRIGKIGVVVIGLVPFNVNGECTPTPDCASIGYTETSCETLSIKCPFDQSKLYCFPCDSAYQYTCSGVNIIGGSGVTCNGKFAQCECIAGAIFNKGICICDNSCSVGNIYYSDSTCSSCLDTSKTPIGVVVKDNELIMSNKKSTLTWAETYKDTSLTNYANATDAKTDFYGKLNTSVIIAEHSSNTIYNNAAVYCNSYTTQGTSAGDWYLPAVGEIYNYVYGNSSILLKTWINILAWDSSFGYWFWSSTEGATDAAWGVGSGEDYVYYTNKNIAGSIICFLAINQ